MSVAYRLHYAPDNASLIVRLVLEALEQPFETVLVDRRARGQKAAHYLKINPHGLIPALETPDGPIFETGAILLWLADRHAALAPTPERPDRAAFLKWHFFVSNTLHTGMRTHFYPDQYIGADSTHQAALRRHMQGELSRHLDTLDALADKAPVWFSGAGNSVLDFYVACLLRWMALYPEGGTGWFDLRNWPHLLAFAARLEPCEAVQRAIHAEGLGPRPFTAPVHATPPEGSAT